MRCQFQPNFHIITKPINRSYLIIHEPLNLNGKWHYHNEIQLLYFVNGSVNCIIGDQLKEFHQGDLILLGANLPHLLRKNDASIKQHPDNSPVGVILQFKETFLGQEFIDSPEMADVKLLFKRAKQGIKFNRDFVSKIESAILNFTTIPENRKLLVLIDLLVSMAEVPESQTEILTMSQSHDQNLKDEERMIRIKDFLQANFTEKITICDMAALVNMSETSFCRFFMSRTFKNFTQYINEMRISHSCTLLSKPGVNVTDACYECGFNSLSYFNRQFKKIIGMSPKIYQQKRLQLLQVREDD